MAESDGEKQLLVASTPTLKHSLVGTGDEVGNAIRVGCTTLGQILVQNSIESCDFLKIDCEDAEYEMILTTPDVFLRRVSRMAIEWHAVPGHTVNELVKRLRSAGYRVQRSGEQDSTVGYVYASLADGSPS